MLKEQLLDICDDPERGEELKEVERDEPDLQKEVERLKLDYPAESPEVRAVRLKHKDSIDRVVIVAYGIVVAFSVLSCAIAMWFSASEVLTVLFTISFLQGPLVLYQRLQIMKSNSSREAIAELWHETVSLQNENSRIEDEIAAMQKDLKRLKAKINRYKLLVEGYDLPDITNLYHESESILFQKKQLAEAIGLQELTKSILSTDQRDHFVGEAELSLLAQRIESIEGVPFRTGEVCQRFRQEEEQTLDNLADLCTLMYIEKRRVQHATKILVDGESPRKLGAQLLWKKKAGITV
ncbi:hypothetical protein ACHAXT_003282 [Thalassiosira profunda]